MEGFETTVEKFDYIVIGGGFYGICIALHLRKRNPKASIKIIENEKELMSRASYGNQARVHNGYHYPKSFVTAFRSRVNLPHFLNDFPFSVRKNFIKLYGIPRKNSKINPSQFSRFCKSIEAPFVDVTDKYNNIFNNDLVDRVFETKEYAFDAVALREWANKKLSANRIRVELGRKVNSIKHINGRVVFNATYSGLGKIRRTKVPLKHEVAEMALIKVPDILKGIGVTLMDGPFFSVMPFPSRGLWTLSHVRYTPHYSWIDDGRCPYEELEQYAKETRYDRMLRDSMRYLPCLEQSKYVDSIFEIKTVLSKNEVNDGRPILFESYDDHPGFYTVLGGKLDNIYDILKRIDSLI
jgi:hypothetical protein